MKTYTVSTNMTGGKSVTTDTENVANFGHSPLGQQAFAIWLNGMAQMTDAVVIDRDTGAALAGDVGQLVPA